MRPRKERATFTCGLALAGALLWPAAARAQEIKAGFSSATISFATGSDSQDLPGGSRSQGLVGGVAFLLPGNKDGGIQVEVLLHQKGVRNLLRQDDRIRLTYLEVPVLLHVDFARQGRSNLYVVGGVAPAFNLRASYEDDGVTEDIKHDIERFDLGISAGLGFERRPLTLEARYTWGLRSVFQDGDLDGTFKNRTLAVMAGIRFGR
jgi:hypothetical protein